MVLVEPRLRTCSHRPTEEVKFRLTCRPSTVVTLAVIVHHVSSELFVNNGRQSRTNLTDLVQLVYGSSSNLKHDQRIAACNPRHHESRGGGSIRSAIGSDSARGSSAEARTA